MLKILKSLLIVSFVFVVTTSYAAITPNPTAPTVAAKSYVLQDFASGRVLAEQNSDQRLPPASITKLMTAYVVSHELQHQTLLHRLRGKQGRHHLDQADAGLDRVQGVEGQQSRVVQRHGHTKRLRPVRFQGRQPQRPG